MIQNKLPYITEQTKRFYDALTKRGVSATLEHSDGHKHIDIAILPAHIFIEIDGMHHYTDPDQIERDFKRDHFSDGDDFDTIHIPNIVIEHCCDDVADAMTSLVNKRLNHV